MSRKNGTAGRAGRASVPPPRPGGAPDGDLVSAVHTILDHPDAPRELRQAVWDSVIDMVNSHVHFGDPDVLAIILGRARGRAEAGGR